MATPYTNYLLLKNHSCSLNIHFPWLNNLKFLDGRKSHFFRLKYLFFHPWDSATWAAAPFVPPVAPLMSGSGEGTLKRGEKLDTTGKLKSHRLYILHYGRVSTYYMCVTNTQQIQAGSMFWVRTCSKESIQGASANHEGINSELILSGIFPITSCMSIAVTFSWGRNEYK